jgi:hypothetical protein
MTRLLTSDELKFVQRKPLESELSLENLRLYYEEHLMNRTFEFELDEPSQPIVKLLFEADNLCHLIGFQYIFEGEQNARDYVGASGYKKIRNGLVTMNTFKEPRIKTKFKEQRERILYFAFLYQLIKNPSVILFSPKHLRTNISTEFIFYNKENNRFIHLGVDKHPGTDYYFPRTFFVRKDDKYLTNQTPVTVLHISETII